MTLVLQLIIAFVDGWADTGNRVIALALYVSVVYLW